MKLQEATRYALTIIFPEGNDPAAAFLHVFSDGVSFTERFDPEHRFAMTRQDAYNTGMVSEGCIYGRFTIGKWDNAYADMEAFSTAFPTYKFIVRVTQCLVDEQNNIIKESAKYDEWRFSGGTGEITADKQVQPLVILSYQAAAAHCNTNTFGDYVLPVYDRELLYIDDDRSVHYRDILRNKQFRTSIGRFVRYSVGEMYFDVPESIMQQVIDRVSQSIDVEATELRIGDEFDDFDIAYRDIHSCMSQYHEECAMYYTEIEGVSMARLCTLGGDTVARCLIWEQHGDTVIDRRYGATYFTQTLLRKLRELYPNAAVRIGECKQSDSFEGEGLKIAERMSFYCDADRHPYMDTFAGYKNSRLTVGFDLKETDFDPAIVCDNCGDDCDEQDFISVDEANYCCPDCAEAAGYLTCDYCDEWYFYENEGIEVGEDGDNHYCCEDCAEKDGWMRCEECGDWCRPAEGVMCCEACEEEKREEEESAQTTEKTLCESVMSK